MNSTVLLISEEYIKNNSTVGDNTLAQYIAPSIIDSQLIGLQPIIGTHLYDTLCEMVENDGLTDDYSDLLGNYISLYLLNKVQANMMVALFAKMRNAGVVNYYDEHQTQLDLKSIQFIREEYENKAAFYARRMQDYLCANNSKFPEYKVKRDCADLSPDKQDSFASNFNFHKINVKH